MSPLARMAKLSIMTGLALAAFNTSVEGTGSGQCSTACATVETACKNNKLQTCGKCNYDYATQKCTTPYCATSC